ncbi:MAG: nucleotide exchange factor GrpE [Pseudonocardia sp.]|nr:nucleotide exchange factor GrpE [Pseudonocardia sp.]
MAASERRDEAPFDPATQRGTGTADEPDDAAQRTAAARGTARRGAGASENEEAARAPAPAIDQQPETDAAFAELEDRWRRAAADLDNLRKRYARELNRELVAERARVAGAWLPVLDGLDRALDHARGDSSPVAQGVRMVRDEAVEVMARLGFPRDTDTGVPFDPRRHEVAGIVEDADATPGTVVAVIRPGYGGGDRLLRPAQVVVFRPRE